MRLPAAAAGMVAVLSAAGAVVAGGSSPATIATLNLTSARALDPVAGYELLHLAAAITGLANRDAPRILTLFHPSDSAWLQQEQAAGGWLAGATINPVANVTDAVSMYLSVVKGVAVYESGVYPTSLLAGTAAAAESLLPVVDGSTLQQYLTNELGLVVGLNMTGMFGPGGSERTTSSIKADAYNWAIKRWIAGPRQLCDARVLGYYVDSFAATEAVSDFYDKATVLNHDWVIARGGFLFDLGAWPDEVPKDDPGQAAGTDLKTLQALLGAAYNQTGGAEFSHIAGFTPWAYKYVNANHGGVATEWQTVKIVTAYNAFVDADACCIGGFSSASFWQHRPLPRRLPAVARASTPQQLLSRGLLVRSPADGSLSVAPGNLFFHFYQGDYDSAAWLQSQIMARWLDPQRGSLPLSWPIDPVLSRRFPPAFAKLWAEATANDTFTTGDSGIGYLNPPMLLAPARAQVSGLPGASEEWAALSSTLYARTGVRFTGFIINGVSGPVLPETEQLYAGFSPDGIVEEGFPGIGPHLVPSNTTAVFAQTDIATDAPAAAQAILSDLHTVVPTPQSPSSFHMYRSVLTSPTYLQQVEAAVSAGSAGRAVLLSPTDVAALARVQLGGAGPTGASIERVTYVSDTLPQTWPVPADVSAQLVLAARGSATALNLSVELRNDGWTDLNASTYHLTVNVSLVSLPPQPAGRVASMAPPGSWEARDRVLRLADSEGAVEAASAYALPLQADLLVGSEAGAASGMLSGGKSVAQSSNQGGEAVIVVEYALQATATSEILRPVWREAFEMTQS